MKEPRLLVVPLTERNLVTMAYIESTYGDQVNKDSEYSEHRPQKPHVFFVNAGAHANAHQLTGMCDIIQGHGVNARIYLPPEGLAETEMCRTSAKRIFGITSISYEQQTRFGEYLFTDNDETILQLRKSDPGLTQQYTRPLGFFSTASEEARAKDIPIEKTELYSIIGIFKTLVKLPSDCYYMLYLKFKDKHYGVRSHNPIITMYNVAKCIHEEARETAIWSGYIEDPTSWL